MKRLISLFAVIALTQACGSEEGSQSASNGASNACQSSNWLGTWQASAPNDTLKVYPDCTALSSYCGGKYTYSLPNGNGTFNLSVSGTNGNALCAPNGSYSCAYNDSTPGQLTIDCGGGAIVYTKQ